MRHRVPERERESKGLAEGCHLGEGDGQTRQQTQEQLNDELKSFSLEELKERLIQDFEERVEDRIIERTNADLIEKLISNAEDKNEAIAIAELGLTLKRTGFHFDKRLDREQTDRKIRYLVKNEDLSFTDGSDKPHHKLIIGDNYPALQNLLISHKGEVDVIYIDPPYGKNDMGDFAETNYNNAITRDNLLSMLYPRLVLALELLTDDGVIFCSVDDRNHAYVKCLFDEVFRECNFIASFVIVRAEGGGQNKQAIIGHDYCLAYAKEIGDHSKIARTRGIRGKRITIEGKDYWLQEDWLRKEFGKYGTCHYEEIEEYKGAEKKKEIDEGIAEGKYYLIEKANGMHVVGKPVSIEESGGAFYTVLKHLNADGNNEINSLGIKFSYPKPSDLIKEMVGGATFYKKKTSAKILDFYAGSGTTGQAVAELNREDGGNRQFILVTNNEVTEVNPKGIAYDVTAKRLKRTMTGECYDGSSDFPWLKNHEPCGGSLDVFEIAEVADYEYTEGQTPFDVINEKNYGEDFGEDLSAKIEWVCRNFEQTQHFLGDEE